MTIFALILVTTSAFMHAAWNFISKRHNPSAVFFFLASLVAVIIFLPVLFIFWAGLKEIPGFVWILIGITGFVQAIYYIFLAAAYRNGDLSLAYPLARSLPVVLVALVSVLLGRGSQIQPLAYLGFGMVALGCILLPLTTFKDIRVSTYRQAWVFFALLAAFCITAYTLLDDQALRTLRSLPEAPLSNLGWALLFVELETISLTIFLAIFLVIWGPARRNLIQARWKEWSVAGLTGIIITTTYGLVLLAMAYVSNVSYVFAFRQLSIPIGAMLGILVRKEAVTLPKMVGIFLVVTGLILAAAG